MTTRESSVQYKCVNEGGLKQPTSETLSGERVNRQREAKSRFIIQRRVIISRHYIRVYEGQTRRQVCVGRVAVARGIYTQSTGGAGQTGPRAPTHPRDDQLILRQSPWTLSNRVMCHPPFALLSLFCSSITRFLFYPAQLQPPSLYPQPFSSRGAERHIVNL